MKELFLLINKNKLVAGVLVCRASANQIANYGMNYTNQIKEHMPAVYVLSLYGHMLTCYCCYLKQPAIL